MTTTIEGQRIDRSAAEGTAVVGARGTATAGCRGTAVAGDWGIATAGYQGTAMAGDWGTATAGYWGTLILRRWDKSASRYRVAIGYVGEAGIAANVAYRLDTMGRFERAARTARVGQLYE